MLMLARKSVAVEDLELPTKQQLQRLPLRAILALAVRCVRRVQSLYNSDHPGCGTAIERALSAAESFARGESGRAPLGEVKFAVKWARNSGSRFIAQSALYLLEATLVAARANDREDAQLVAYRAWLSMAAAYNADPDISFIYTTQDDFAHLSVACDARFPQPGEAIDPGPDGPLGPIWMNVD